MELDNCIAIRITGCRLAVHSLQYLMQYSFVILACDIYAKHKVFEFLEILWQSSEQVVEYNYILYKLAYNLRHANVTKFSRY